MWWHWKVISSSRCSLYSGNSGHIKKTQRYSACLPCANTWFDPQHLKKHVGVSLFLWEATGRRWLSTHQEESCSPEPNWLAPWSWMSRFQDWRNQFLSLKHHNLWYFVTSAQADSDSAFKHLVLLSGSLCGPYYSEEMKICISVSLTWELQAGRSQPSRTCLLQCWQRIAPKLS